MVARNPRSPRLDCTRLRASRPTRGGWPMAVTPTYSLESARLHLAGRVLRRRPRTARSRSLSTRFFEFVFARKIRKQTASAAQWSAITLTWGDSAVQRRTGVAPGKAPSPAAPARTKSRTAISAICAWNRTHSYRHTAPARPSSTIPLPARSRPRCCLSNADRCFSLSRRFFLDFPIISSVTRRHHKRASYTSFAMH